MLKSGVEITIPGHVKKIGVGAFSECGLKKVTIENGVTVIDGGAFSANQLTSVTIPKSVVKIGSDAFSYNKKLTSVKFAEGKLEYIGDNAFNKCDLRSFSPPSTVRFMGVCLLEFNDNLESISIPASMNTVPFTSRDSEFKKLTKLVIARGVKAIENIIRYPKLKTIELPDTLISINPFTFKGSNIEKLSIPEGTNFIGYVLIHYRRIVSNLELTTKAVF